MAFAAAAILAVGLSSAVAPASAADLAVPPEVSASLANATADPQGAATSWAAWAATAPMTYVRNAKRPKTRSKCRMDSLGRADCDDFAEVVGRGNRNMGMKKISEVITDGKRQFFRDPPLKKWTRTRTASNPNPITGAQERVGFNPWLPWSTGGESVSARVLANGTVEITATNPAPGDLEPARTIVRIASNGLQGTFIEYDAKDRVAATTRITFQPVADIRIPKGG